MPSPCVNKIFSEKKCWYKQEPCQPVNIILLARPMPSQNRPCNACLRHSQQLSQNAGKHPKSGLLLRLGNTISNFKESPIPIIGRKPESPILSKPAKPDCQPSRTNAIPSRLDPANDTGKPHDPTRSPIRHDHTPADPVHYNNATRHTLPATAWHMTHTQGRHRAGGR
jgi:hypothetical protein